MDRQEPVKTAETSQGPRAPPRACAGVRPCPPLALGPAASSSAGRPELREGFAEEAQCLLLAAVPGRHICSSRARAGGSSGGLEEPLPSLLGLRG